MMKEQLPKPTLIEDLGLLYPTENSKARRRIGLYKCGFCGTEFKAIKYNISSGRQKSCGCYHIKKAKESSITHNLTNTRIYRTWRSIKDRALNPKNKRYKDYLGRGITICDAWKNDFMSFYTWSMLNGYSDELSIDRIDNDGNYEPNNCRWTTNTIQCRNRRMQKSNKSGYKGVSYVTSRGKYVAQICINNKNIYLGAFPTAVEAGIAYNNYIIDNNLEGFILNEIPNKSLTDE